jgi:hypothetical protein
MAVSQGADPMFTRSFTVPAATLAVAALMALTSYPRAAQAADVSQDKMPASYGSMMKMDPMDVMHMMDGGKKGYVSREDFMKFHEAMFVKMDKNKDGKLTEDEFVARTHAAP